MVQYREIEALVEISCGLSERAQHARLRWAYRRSRKGLVVLVLNDVPLDHVNRLLDPVVKAEGNNVHGVLFVRRDEEESLSAAAAAARRVLPATDVFRKRLGTWRGDQAPSSAATPRHQLIAAHR